MKTSIAALCTLGFVQSQPVTQLRTYAANDLTYEFSESMEKLVNYPMQDYFIDDKT